MPPLRESSPPGWQRDLASASGRRAWIGFNKMPGLDVYFAADPCYEEKAQTLRNPLYRLSGRYRHFAAYERAVFAPESPTQILMISEVQQPFFEKHYATPKERFPPAAAGHRAGSPGAANAPRSAPNSAASSGWPTTICCCCRSAPASRPRAWTAA
jgi:hypothetical protein